MVKNPPANAGDIRDTGSAPGSGRSPGGGNGNPLQYSYLENPMEQFMGSRDLAAAALYKQEELCRFIPFTENVHKTL